MKQAILAVDLGYGDCGKGTIVDSLVRQTGASLVVRFNGGPQAAHAVVLPNGRHHVFSQFGSGTLVPGTYTFLSKHCLVNPLLLMEEAKMLQKLGIVSPIHFVSIDARALMVTPFHRAMNRLREISRGKSRHGSCGMGIGETMAYWSTYPDRAPRIGDIGKVDFAWNMHILRKEFQEEVVKLKLPKTLQVEQELSTLFSSEVFSSVLSRYVEFLSVAHIVPNADSTLDLHEKVIFEPAQGVLLDEWRGFHPYTTWSTTTLTNADDILREYRFTGDVKRIGITRAYMTRHGPGPFPTEDKGLEIPDSFNGNNQWQRDFRIGWLDIPALRYSVQCVGSLDGLAVTNLDRLPTKSCVCYAYENMELRPTEIPDLAEQESLTNRLFHVVPKYKDLSNGYLNVITELEDQLKLPVLITSNSPTWEGKTYLNSSLTKF